MNRSVRLQYSDDGGYNWSNWDEETLGQVGEYNTRVVFTQLGSCRNRVFRITCSSPVKRDFLGGVATIQGTIG